MKRSISSLLILLVALTTVSAAWSAPVTEHQARQIAASFMSMHAMPAPSPTLAGKAPRRMGATGSQAAYYVFNNGAAGGYVIVAGDDRAPAVLGYSDTGSFDTSDVPEALQELLEDYAAQIEALGQGDSASVSPHLTSRAPIAPLLTSSWSQNAPYNIKLPYINGKHAYVGCVATAMSQIMYYWKWPQGPTATIPAYTSDELKIYMPSLPPTTFAWSAMQDNYLTTDTVSAAASAVAQLALYCAQSLEMDFKKNSSSSSTQDIAQALITYYGYDPGARYVQRKYFSTEQWEDLLYAELQAKRPVVYKGQKQSGHSFICDGYDGNGMFHINWGWNSASNGYFLLNILNPDQQGTGGASGTYGYVASQAMVTGIRPSTSSTSDALDIYVRQIVVNYYNNLGLSPEGSTAVTLTTHYLNGMPEPVSFYYGLALYRDNTMLYMLDDEGYYENLSPNHYVRPMLTVNLANGLPDGTYRIVPVYRATPDAEWKPCLGADMNYVLVVKEDWKFTIEACGSGSVPSYKVNNIDVTGHMHPNRPVFIDMNLTNNGHSTGDILYLYENGKLASMGYLDIAPGASGTTHMEYWPETTGNHTLQFSLDDKGTSPIASRTIVITPMPSANLSSTARVLHVTDSEARIITSDKFSVELTVTNNGTETYDEDIVMKLYKHIYDNTGSAVQLVTRSVRLAPGQSTTVQYDMDNVQDGWRYFARPVYYSAGEEVKLRATSFYTIHYPTPSQVIAGDVNGDGEVNINDINALIDYLIGGQAQGISLEAADCNHDGEVNISDVNAIIDIIIG